MQKDLCELEAIFQSSEVKYYLFSLGRRKVNIIEQALIKRKNFLTIKNGKI